MRRITTLGLATIAALVLTACGSECGEPQPDPSTSTPASPTPSTGTIEGGTSAGTDTGGTTP